jgi:hypothetical protein
MRPEYLDAVNAARGGWLLWWQLLVPAALIWVGIFRFRRPNPRQAMFIASCIICWKLMVLHSNSIQDSKKSHAQTDAEWVDVAQDTWNLMAPGSSVIWSVVYCGLLYGAMNATRATLDWRQELRVAAHAA